MLVLDSTARTEVYTSWKAGSGISFIVNADTVGFTAGNGRYGDTVTVERAGDVIPHVVSVDFKRRKKKFSKIYFSNQMSFLWF